MFELIVDCQRRVNQIVHSLMVGFKVRGRDFTIVMDHMLEEITARDSEETGIFIF